MEQRLSEPTHPAHLHHQLLAGRLHLHPNCRRCAKRSPIMRPAPIAAWTGRSARIPG